MCSGLMESDLRFGGFRVSGRLNRAAIERRPQPLACDGCWLLTRIGPECNKFGMEPLVASLSTLGAVALVFIIARSLVLWYWKIDRGITLLERQNQLLEQQSSLLIKLVATQKVALLESSAPNPSSP